MVEVMPTDAYGTQNGELESAKSVRQGTDLVTSTLLN